MKTLYDLLDKILLILGLLVFSLQIEYAWAYNSVILLFMYAKFIWNLVEMK